MSEAVPLPPPPAPMPVPSAPGGPQPPPPPPPIPPAPSGKRHHSFLRDAIEILAIAVILYLAIWNVLQTVRVEGDSMQPTLQSDNLLLASKLSYHLHDPERGDIVILNPPGQPSGPERDFIKRVIGIPGDVVEIDSSKRPTQLLIKPGGSGPWQRASEPYLGEPWEQGAPCCDSNGRALTTALAPGAPVTPQPLTVPKDRYFVLGDNRNRSSDSRVFGLVEKGRITAKAWVRIWPINHLGSLGAGPALLPSALLVPLGTSRLLRRHRRHAGRRNRAQLSRAARAPATGASR